MFNLDFSACSLRINLKPPLYDWQTRTVWPKIFKTKKILWKQRHLHLGCPWGKLKHIKNSFQSELSLLGFATFLLHLKYRQTQPLGLTQNHQGFFRLLLVRSFAGGMRRMGKNLRNLTNIHQELTPSFTHLWALSGSHPYWGFHCFEDQEDESIPYTSNTLLSALFFLLVDSLSRAINHSSVWLS